VYLLRTCAVNARSARSRRSSSVNASSPFRYHSCNIPNHPASSPRAPVCLSFNCESSSPRGNERIHNSSVPPAAATRHRRWHLHSTCTTRQRSLSPTVHEEAVTQAPNPCGRTIAVSRTLGHCTRLRTFALQGSSRISHLFRRLRRCNSSQRRRSPNGGATRTNPASRCYRPHSGVRCSTLAPESPQLDSVPPPTTQLRQRSGHPTTR
jgi:hypothetical protein